MNKAALLIGVSEYDSESGLKALPSAAEDVQAMQRMLLKSSEFTAESITVLTNPRKGEVEDAIYRLFADRQKEDLLLFYFSGHGIKDETGKLYFSLPTTRKNQNGSLIKHTAVPATVLHENMNDSRSTCQVLVLDCCFSGAFAKGLTIKDDDSIDVRTQLGGKGRAILTSSNSIEYSFHKDSLKLSVYTHFFVEGLEKGAADLDSDGLISADEMHIYVSEKVKQTAPKMTPQFFPAEQGHRIYLGRSPKDDPQLKYRKVVEQKVSQGSFQVAQNRFSIPARKALDLLSSQLEIAAGVVATIEEEATEPLREYQRRLQDYERTLRETLEDEVYPFKEAIQVDLSDYQLLLGLRDEDVQEVKVRVLPNLVNISLDPPNQPVSSERQTEREINFPFFDKLIELVKRNINGSKLWNSNTDALENGETNSDSETRLNYSRLQEWIEAKNGREVKIAITKTSLSPTFSGIYHIEINLIKHRTDLIITQHTDDPQWTRRLFLKGAISVGLFGGTSVVASQYLGNQPPQSPPSLTSNIPSKNSPVELSSSSINVDYSKLEGFLKTDQWKEADRETTDLILKVANQEQEGWLNPENINNFPCDVLSMIDRLWLDSSSGRFGFSIQKKIFVETCGSNLGGQYDEKVWQCFGDRVGWRVNNKWISDNDVIFNTQASHGHLPIRVWGLFMEEKTPLPLWWLIPLVGELSFFQWLVFGKNEKASTEGLSSFMQKLVKCSI